MFHCPVGVWVIEQHAIIVCATVRSPTVVLDMPVFERFQTLLHPELTPWWSFLLADGAHHKKPHSPTHPNILYKNIQQPYDIQ